MKGPLFAFALALASAPLAFSWGAQGHAAIGLVAEQNLTADSRRHVESLLGNDDLAAIASWMDDLRGAAKGFGKLAANPEAREFVKRFPQNTEWHYVDFPLGAGTYREDSPFARPDDVVHEIKVAIDVLEGHGTPGIPPRIALYMLVHFVGDLHQPLHVACGYYDLSSPEHPKLLTDPAQARGQPDDQGANLLHFGPERYDELHAYWDSALPRKVAHGGEPAKLAKVLMDALPAAGAATPGDYHHWAEDWATESIAAANQAYDGIVFGSADVEDGRIRQITITLPANYDERMEPVAERRMALAGYRLAALLNTIHWAN
ncbi:MAG TPA: S1/P1 nuclease [Opitutaceae bacterium]|jgi:hypothetical protein